MPRGGPPAYAEDTCKCGHGEPPLARAGRYRGLCETGKAEQLEAERARRAAKESPPAADAVDGITPHETRAHKPRLVAACNQLAKAAEKLERAVDAKRSSHVAAQAALSDFKGSLDLVATVARNLVHVYATPRAQTEED